VSRERAPVTNIAASVRARLLNLAKRDGRDFGAVLRLFFIERFLYRLSISRYRDDFLLKGALLFFARADADRRAFTRPTKDVDLEALALRPDLGELAAAFRAIAETRADDDGVRFDPGSVTVDTIREDDRYGGLRGHVVAQLEGARDRIQIDIGFGDAVTPGPLTLRYPTFLADLPVPDLNAYPVETVVAEKWEATVSLGEANSRMKDLIDLDELAGTAPFDGVVLQEAMRRTFERRRTGLAADAAPLTDAYANDRERQALWAAARRRYQRSDTPERLAEAMARVLAFVGPPYIAAVQGRPFSGRWDPARRTWLRDA
jgi:hypothetical protein